MPRVLTVDGSVKIGAYRFPDRKKPCLCVEKGNIHDNPELLRSDTE